MKFNLRLSEAKLKGGNGMKDYFGYLVSKDGRVFGKRGFELSTTETCRGYFNVTLTFNGKNTSKSVHRLVAETFLPNPFNLKCVNHKDENKHNNNVSNLEWCNYEYNNTYKDIHLRRNKDNTTRKVIQYDLDMNEIKRWDSIIEAANNFNTHSSNIMKCCIGERNHVNGFKWRYYE